MAQPVVRYGRLRAPRINALRALGSRTASILKATRNFESGRSWRAFEVPAGELGRAASQWSALETAKIGAPFQASCERRRIETWPAQLIRRSSPMDKHEAFSKRSRPAAQAAAMIEGPRAVIGTTSLRQLQGDCPMHVEIFGDAREWPAITFHSIAVEWPKSLWLHCNCRTPLG